MPTSWPKSSKPTSFCVRWRRKASPYTRGNAEDKAGRWLLQASDESADACDLRKRGRYYLILFHFQQAAEKALKAYLYLKLEELDVFRTHSVAELAEAAEKINQDFSRVKRSESLDA